MNDKVVHTQINSYSIYDDIEILGHVFHGLRDVRTHVEMSLYKDYSQGPADAKQPRKTGPVHVGEMWMPYPCFDDADFANENRSYRNYIFRDRPITQADMEALSDLPTHGNEYRFASAMPADTLPILYYQGDGNKMELAVPGLYIKIPKEVVLDWFGKWCGLAFDYSVLDETTCRITSMKRNGPVMKPLFLKREKEFEVQLIALDRGMINLKISLPHSVFNPFDTAFLNHSLSFLGTSNNGYYSLNLKDHLSYPYQKLESIPFARLRFEGDDLVITQ